MLYHGNCSDGFGGAWAAWKHFKDDAEYIPLSHITEPPKLEGREIYMIDFVYRPEITKELVRLNTRVTAIDHHVTAEEATKTTQDYVYDLNHSGAVLAWRYFHPQEPTPLLLQYVEDVDLWKFQLPSSREVNLYLNLFNFSFAEWDKLAEELEDETTRGKIIEQGKLLLAFQQKLVEKLISFADLVEFEGYQVPAVNAPEHISELGHALVVKHPPFAIIWNEVHGKIKVSLRSDGSVDVAEIAMRHGGGGHRAAAGFSFDADKEVPWRRTQK